MSIGDLLIILITNNSSENWLNRIGQLDKVDREAIEEQLKYFLNIQDNPSEDWFVKNASPEIVKKVFDYLSKKKKISDRRIN